MLNWFKSKLSSSDTSPKPIVIVSGLPRSGTSMMMKMLEAGGIPPLTDAIRTADDDNPRGYYEFERVKQMSQGDTDWLNDASGKVVKVISELLKHLPADHTYKLIFMRRDISEILASQKKMLVRNGKSTDKISDEQLTILFEKHFKMVGVWLDNQPNIEYLYVSYNQLLTSPSELIRRIALFLSDYHLDETSMIKVIDPTLYRQREGN